MCPAMIDEQADRDDADEGRLLEDVQEDADLEEVRDRRPRNRQHDDEDEPDEIVEDELDERPLPGREIICEPRDGDPGPLRGSGTDASADVYSTGLTGSVGGFRLPQKRGSSTLSLVIAAPGILMFGPQLSIVSTESSPSTS